jgi:hypothetical protein
MAQNKCPDCGSQISVHGMSSHRRGLVCEAECAAVRARKDGLERCYGITLSWLRKHGLNNIRFEKLPTGYRPGFKGRRAKIVNEVWVDAWISLIWNWPSESLDDKEAAIVRLARHPELRSGLAECASSIEFDDCTVELGSPVVGYWDPEEDLDPQVIRAAYVRIPTSGQVVKRLDFDKETGRIVKVYDGIELRYVVLAKDAIEMFARCGRAIRRLASER